MTELVGSEADNGGYGASTRAGDHVGLANGADEVLLVENSLDHVGEESDGGPESDEVDDEYFEGHEEEEDEEDAEELTFEDDLASLGREIDELKQLHVDMEVRVAHLFKVSDRLQEGLSLQLERVTAGREDLSDQRHLDQIRLAEDFQVFVEQRIVPAAVRECKQAKGIYRPDKVARLVGATCAALFRFPDDRLVNLTKLKPSSEPWLIASQHLAVDAGEIYERASRTGLPFYWDFYLQPGVQLDENWQEAWTGCDTAWPVRFVVAPAYVVGGSIFYRQRVFTSLGRSRQGRESAGRASTFPSDPSPWQRAGL